MKSKTLDRPMFKKPIDDTDVENVGIMQGFMDEDDDLDYAEYMQEDVPDEDSDMASIMDRRPDSPEILMNNLRGDMRSIDARVEELADLVGYNAASETPEGVLALLQPVLAAQQAPQMPPEMPQGMMPQGMPQEAMMPQGMPQEAMMPQGIPQEAMMPQGMPQEMPPEMMGGIGALPTDQGPEMGAPVMMAKGGPVQYFRDGSDEDGVTPEDMFPFMDDDTSSLGGRFPPEVVAAAREHLLAASQQGSNVPDLATEVERRIPMYEDLMGVDKNLSQAQILFELGQRAFNYGANVDDQGKPLRGSAAARLAGAVRTLPGSIGQITGQMDQQQRGVRGAALQASERNIENMMQNQARMEGAKTAAASRVLAAEVRAKGTTRGPFGSGVEGSSLNILNEPGLMERYGEGLTSPEENNLITTAWARYNKPTEMTFTDNLGNTVTKIIRPEPLDFVIDAMNKRKKLGMAAPRVAQIPPLSLNQDSVVVGTPSPSLERKEAPVKRYKQADWGDTLNLNPNLQNFYNPDEDTMFNNVEGTGVIPKLAEIGQKIPIAGAVLPGEESARRKRVLQNNSLEIKAMLANNPKFGEGEQIRINEAIDILPKFIDRPEALAVRLESLDSLFKALHESALTSAQNENLPRKDRNEALGKIADIIKARKLIGAPIIIDNTAAGWKKAQQLPVGTKYLYRQPGQPLLASEVYE
jgi:hypothetical protein